MRDARGMCPVPSTAQRRASGFWCRAVEASTAFSHDDRTTPVPSQITSRCIRRLRLNALMVYVALVADVLVGAYADINYSSSTQMDVMTLVFQACAFLLTIMCFYNIAQRRTS